MVKKVIKHCGDFPNGLFRSTRFEQSRRAHQSIEFTNERFVAEINQHRMVLEIKPTAENIETAVLRPGVPIGNSVLIDAIDLTALTV